VSDGGWEDASFRPARGTLVVVRELFENAQKSVLIGGDAFDRSSHGRGGERCRDHDVRGLR